MQFGMWVWNLAKCEGGDPPKIAAKCRTVGLNHIVLKVADGTALFNGTLLKPVVETLKANGLAVWVWAYTYGKDPAREAEVFGIRAARLGADGLVVDLEGDAYANPDGRDRVRQYFSTLKRVAPGLPCGLSSHRFPPLHSHVPIADAMAWCDFGDPQCYYLHPNINAQMEWAIREWRVFGKPVAATGAAYPEGTGDPANIGTFVTACRLRQVDVVRWWSWEHCTPAMWREIDRAIKGGGVA
jgi:hypothetical protein